MLRDQLECCFFKINENSIMIIAWLHTMNWLELSPLLLLEPTLHSLQQMLGEARASVFKPLLIPPAVLELLLSILLEFLKFLSRS